MQRKQTVGFTCANVEGLLEEEDGPSYATNDEEGDCGTTTPGETAICRPSTYVDQQMQKAHLQGATKIDRHYPAD